ncbi:MAG: helicase-associated domain-containing protein, partial [Chitinispirillaceae bacterium]|nr:helicase-associated domain-containing protein [Chitinispirillaceae bacterium]
MDIIFNHPDAATGGGLFLPRRIHIARVSCSTMIFPQNPLIIQSNRTLLLEVNNPLFTDARNAVCAFAHLEKSPEYLHTYSITPLSLWNAAALGITSGEVVERLKRFSKYPIPRNVVADIDELMGRFGKLVLENDPDGLVLRCIDPGMLLHLVRHPSLQHCIGAPVDAYRVRVAPEHRGLIKQVLIGIGYPAHDRAGFIDGAPHP